MIPTFMGADSDEKLLSQLMRLHFGPILLNSSIAALGLVRIAVLRHVVQTPIGLRIVAGWRFFACNHALLERFEWLTQPT